MKRTAKTAEASRHEAAGWGGAFRVAIVGAGTLKGKELKDVIGERNFPSADVKLLDDEEVLGQIEAVGDEPTFIQSVLPEHMANVDFTFFASDEAYTAKTWTMAKDSGSEIIDLSYALEKHEGAVLRAPWTEKEFGVEQKVELASAPVVIAHPAAVVLALMLSRLQQNGKVRHAIATVFEPASEHGKPGMDELHDQTVNLLSFQQMPMTVFGTQVAFNVVGNYGDESKPTIADVERRITEHFKRITYDRIPMPSLMVLQAPVFHGHTFSIYVEMESELTVEDFQRALSGEHIEITRPLGESPSNVNVAGQTQVQVAVKSDPSHKNGFWIWAASDNLKISATLAVECAEQMMATRPRGTVQ
jgi:aspartate-semialdehyde dehydrogenase